MMSVLKTIHVVCAILSISGFFIRGIWMLMDSTLLQRRWVKITPHIIDSMLLVSAIILAVQWHLSPLAEPWLMAKIVALVVYIALGMVALRFGRNKAERRFAWILGMLTFAYIVSAALSKSALGWLAYF